MTAPADRRRAAVRRETKETSIELTLDLDFTVGDDLDAPSTGTPPWSISTGIGFLDHMIHALAFHSSVALELRVEGDLEVDDHHTAEDTALALGEALDRALGSRAGIRRFGSAYAPLDESLARAVVDLSGRPHATVELGLVRPQIGAIASENLTHFLQSFATAAKCTLHVDLIRGANDHHRAEAAFKAVALALRTAIERSASSSVPSTKGTLTAPVEDPGEAGR